ncbi:LysR family transcriptional regulator [Roseomonas sp. KE2513]|uniref:LysR family transcriptional regulator n=1 Tax=Roseomonas sp. KE2513 TaxID=2479202 RepID=UPI0018DF5621|nr:LysR family transcriptional regulator [Roseomonas sp. KE2513]MBI0538763.1 LysR family transcriptional regulator [Roseomonas sp. KE2513]
MLRASLRCLEVFVAVAEEGRVAAAAERLGITQPSVSEQLRRLEEEAGTPLLERRRGRPSLLTSAGLAFLPQARLLLQDAAAAAATLAEDRAGSVRRIQLSAQRLVANFVLPDLLATFSQQHPDVRLDIRTGGQEEVIDHLLSGSADIGCFLTNNPPANLSSQLLRRERFGIVASATHPLAIRQGLSAAELVSWPFVRGGRRSLLSQELDALLTAAGLPRTKIAPARTTEYDTVRALVRAGTGLLLTMTQRGRRSGGRAPGRA